jgi:lysophospholipase L1-like esterase
MCGTCAAPGLALPAAAGEPRLLAPGGLIEAGLNQPHQNSSPVRRTRELLDAGAVAQRPRGRADSPRTTSGKMHMIGDSLAVGTEPFLNDAWSGMLENAPKGAAATSNAKGGRTLEQGMREYNALKRKPKVVAMSLFTNNAPSDIGELRKAVQQTIRDARQRDGRVVWATIARPDLGGKNYDAANRILRELAAENRDVMGLVDWAREVDRRPGLLSSDDIHATPEGYKVRARMYAQAARG